MTSRRIHDLWPLLLPVGAAGLGARLLAPREPIAPAAPVRADEYFRQDELDRGARFARPQLALSLTSAVLRVGALTAMVMGASRRSERSGRRRPGRSGQPTGLGAAAVAGARLGAVLTGASLPVAVAARRRAIAVGLDTQSWSGWAGDLAKATVIGEVLAAGTGVAAVWLTNRFPRDWWVPAAAGSVAAGAVFGTLAPVLLEPLFNDFTPLPEGQLRSDVLALADTAGVKVGEVYTVDASRRTSGANAYVTGLGPTKRVVMFDTLLDRYSPEEIRVVVAHELSHVCHRDVLRLLAFSAIVSPPAARAVAILSRRLSSDLGTPAALPALALAATLVAAPVGTVVSGLSRAIERRADAESLELSRDPEASISFMRTVAVQNVADVEPPRWVRVLLASHPPTLERIGAAVAYRDRNGIAR